MKTRFLLLVPLALASCAPEVDSETAELSAYYARKGDEMTTTLDRAKKMESTSGKGPRIDPTTKPKPTY